MTVEGDRPANSRAGRLAAAGLGLVVVWAYWPTLVGLVQRWSDDPQASHGFLVPALVGLVLWSRWDARPKVGPGPSYWGLPVLAAAGLVRFLGAYLNLEWLDGASLVVTLVGGVLLLCGVAWLRWAAWGLVLLPFLLPLPFEVTRGLAGTLQRVATVAATYLLQTFGYPAVSEGNTIRIDQVEFGVLEACNGLGMLQSFLLLATTAAVLSSRPAGERVVLFASGLPIALVANLVRITATALLLLHADPAWTGWIHDATGWAMIPLAVGLLWLVCKVMDSLWLEAPAVATRPAANRPPVARATPS